MHIEERRYKVMILRIDHIGIAVKDVEEAVKIYTDSLGLAVEDIEIVAHRHIKVAIIPVGENRIELIQPMSPDIKLVKFLKEKGEGLHHLALQVDDIDQELEALKSKGVPLLDREPGIGTHQRRVAFLFYIAKRKGRLNGRVSTYRGYTVHRN